VGAWGFALFSDDTALDVRDTYHALLESEPPEIEDSDATRQMLARFEDELADPDDGPVVWLALAAVQSKFGRLDPSVADRALRILDNREGLARWEEDGAKSVARRIAALEKVRAQLTGPQPPRRKLPVPRRTTLQPGDVLSYQYPDGRHVLARVARIWRNLPVCALLDFAGRQVPAIDDIATMPDFLWVDRYSPHGRVIPFTGRVHKGVDYAQAGFTLIGNIGPRPGDDDLDATRVTYWAHAADTAVTATLLGI